ncbi:acetolactate synthase I/II/III large subunit [Virgisporangium aliadipatigenens]|uniref:Acetolactate synthase I/II/III large subunit n=1 Tax=Virgisporangium aliadipatigenens TaxID=741659 RepID=A0A8J3YMT4_9ACTN|nr:acetolactate synthase large subunit [Virgisporangium aliadipatigenens]GIJ48409.1 acetolactate synthase I/II/III large subunit [Virgisporangium aliadipatigenens]
MSELTGAQALVRTLIDSDVTVCFANPGTSEMHFVAALDDLPAMRGVLCLFEGVATGAADGYARMAGRPAATLLHLGPGLANGLANLHNARRAHTPLVNVIGDHALAHKPLDSLLESDIDALAGTVSAWVRRPATVGDVGRDAAEAVAAARAGGIATLIVPADVSWSVGAPVGPPVPVAAPPVPSLDFFPGERCALLLDGDALTERGLRAAGRIAAATGARVFSRGWPARQRRGAGVPATEPLAYRGEQVTAQLDGVRDLVLVGARTPVTSFAYPGKPGEPTPAGTRVHTLAPEGSLAAAVALEAWADLVAPATEPVLAPFAPPPLPHGPLDARNWAAVIGALLPAEAILVDESVTGAAALQAATAQAAPHDFLALTGLAIGQGLPSAAGAAIACPDRPVVCVQADGSAMYTISALWTMARERLDVTTVVLNNRSYAILRAELERTGAATGAAAALMDLSDPDLDFVALAAGMGVPATRARTAEELARHFADALREPGPHLIEAVIA